MKLNPKLLKPLTVLQVIAGILAVLGAFAFLRGVFTSWMFFGIPFIVFAVLYVCTVSMRKQVETEAEKAKEAARKKAKEEQENNP